MKVDYNDPSLSEDYFIPNKNSSHMSYNGSTRLSPLPKLGVPPPPPPADIHRKEHSSHFEFPTKEFGWFLFFTSVDLVIKYGPGLLC